jgi:hypothetical protein
MKNRCLALGLATIALVAAPAWAQTRSSSGGLGSSSQGLFGQNTVGSSSNFAAPTASTGGSSNNMQSGGATTAQNPFSQQNAALTASTQAPQITTTQQQGAFVGADTGDTGNLLSRQGAQARGFQNNNFAQLGNLFAQGMQSVNQNNQQGQQRSRTQVRIGLKLGFQPAPIAATSVAAFESRLVKLPGIRFIGPADVTLEGRTAVLRGTVASEDDRDLAEALAKMEPAVQNVRNELVVDSSARAAEELPPASSSNLP